MARHDDIITTNAGVIWVARRGGGWIGFQPMDANASADIVTAICDALDDMYHRGRAETGTP